jgi:putative CocE/NonD family hydrolase
MRRVALCLSAGLFLAARAEADVEMRDVPFVASDGVTLVLDVLLPGDGGGRYPVIFNVTPFGRQAALNDYLGYGYAHVNLQWRGTGLSGGVFRATDARLAQDGYEAIEWAAGQPWSNGKVGLAVGGSIISTAQLHIAALRPPHLVCAVARGGFHDFYRNIFWHNGIFVAGFYAQILAAEEAASASATPGSADAAVTAIRSYLSRPESAAIFAEFAARPLDDDFWRSLAAYPKWPDVEIPFLFVAGLYDFVAGAGVRNFTSVASIHKKLILGPWTHGEVTGFADQSFPRTTADATRPGPANPELEWLDHFLKGVDNGVTGAPAVTLYDLGTDTWRTSSRWPPQGARTQQLFLSGRRSGSAMSLNDGSLLLTPPDPLDPPADSYLYDPATGTGDVGSPSNAAIFVPHIRQDQRPDELLKLTYTTEALAAPWVLTGPAELRFYARSTAVLDTDFIVKLTDVAPDGTSLIIGEGFLRASHRQVDPAYARPAEPWMTNDAAAAIPPGPFECRIDISPLGATIRAGHRLRLAISSSDVATHAAFPEPATNTILHDALHASALIVTAIEPPGLVR